MDAIQPSCPNNSLPAPAIGLTGRLGSPCVVILTYQPKIKRCTSWCFELCDGSCIDGDGDGGPTTVVQVLVHRALG